jgi:hypothetical protein
MSVARTTVRVTGDVTVSQRSFVGRSGDPVGWLDVGERDELGVYGTPGALRRLAAALLIAADAADELIDGGGREAPVRAAA